MRTRPPVVPRLNDFWTYHARCKQCQAEERFTVKRQSAGGMSWEAFYKHVCTTRMPCFVEYCVSCDKFAVFELTAIDRE